jgi:hypothetical protein
LQLEREQALVVPMDPGDLTANVFSRIENSQAEHRECR